MAALKEICVPDIGDFNDVDVIEVLVKPGDAIKKDDSLIALESDKATMEVPSPEAGVVKELKVKVGDKLSEGSIILTLEAEEVAEPVLAAAPSPKAADEAPAEAERAEAPKDRPKTLPPARPEAVPPPPPPHRAPPLAAEPVDEAASSLAHASPAVRRFARELGANLDSVNGTGPKQRILKQDVQAYVKQALADAKAAPVTGFALPEMPAVDFSKFGPTETRPLSRIKKLSGANLHRNWVAIPHVTQHDDADITELEALRKSLQEEAQKQGVRVTLLAFLLKACVAALKKYPEFNASLNSAADSLILKSYYNIGVAVDTAEGLVVPVIRDVDSKGVLKLAAELGELSAKARDKKLSPNEMQGGCFSISSLGGISGTAFTPIINAPEVAILGVSKAVQKPVCRDGQIVARLLLPFSLSYDHRVADGASAARFTQHLGAVLSDARRLIL